MKLTIETRNTTPKELTDTIAVLSVLRDNMKDGLTAPAGWHVPPPPNPVADHLLVQNDNVGAENAKLHDKVAELESKLKASDDTSLELEQCKAKLAEVQSELNDNIVKSSAQDNEIGTLQRSLTYERNQVTEFKANIAGLEAELESARAAAAEVTDEARDEAKARAANAESTLAQVEVDLVSETAKKHEWMRTSEAHRENLARKTTELTTANNEIHRLRNVIGDLHDEKNALAERANQFETHYKAKSDECKDLEVGLEELRGTLKATPLDFVRYCLRTQSYYIVIEGDYYILSERAKDETLAAHHERIPAHTLPQRDEADYVQHDVPCKLS